MAIHFTSYEPPERKPLPKEIVAEPITAWRVWGVSRPQYVSLDEATLARMAEAFTRGENPFVGLLGIRLDAISGGTVWDRGQQKAKCIGPPMSISSAAVTSLHEAPDPNCGCGFWAFQSKEDMGARFAAGLSGPYAYGKVQLWGRVIEHERGYRAEYAKPLEVWVVGVTAEQRQELADFYGCEVKESEGIPGPAGAPRQPGPAGAPRQPGSGAVLQINGSASHWIGQNVAAPVSSVTNSFASFDISDRPAPRRTLWPFLTPLNAGLCAWNLAEYWLNGGWISLSCACVSALATVVSAAFWRANRKQRKEVSG